MNRHSHDDVKSSMEEAGGVAVGFTGTITGFNAGAQARMVDALTEIGKWVSEKSGTLLGHIKCTMYLEDGQGVTLNLTDMDNGVEIHGNLEPAEKVKFNLMCAVLDVDAAALDHEMHHVLDETLLDIELEHHDCLCGNHSHAHDHAHDHCGCGHDHKEHKHEHGECCHDHSHKEHSHDHCGCGHEHEKHEHGECCHGHEEHEQKQDCGSGKKEKPPRRCCNFGKHVHYDRPDGEKPKDGFFRRLFRR